MKKLTKREALDLLPLVVDDETSEDEKVAFFKYIQTDPDVKKKYESLLFVKQLIKTKYSRTSAPDHLKDKISGIIDDLEWEEGQKSKVDNSPSYSGSESEFKRKRTTYNESSDGQESLVVRLMKPARYLVAASVIFIFSLLTIEFLEHMPGERSFDNNSLEYAALTHFQTGSHIEASLASFNPESSDHAFQLLQEHMSYSPRIPKIEGADLRTVLQTTFIDGHNVPVLDFYQAGINESIHVFAFKVGEFDDPGMLNRDPEAVESCQGYDDYHIKNINGKHVVSWKWGDYWYTAVSNHNGNDLIALVEPTIRPDERETGSSGSDW